MAKKQPVKRTALSANSAAPSDALATPIYLKSITLCGIRCFRGPAQTLDLTGADGAWAPWTLILGNNGTGKSTLLQAIGRLTITNDIQEVYPQWARLSSQDLSGEFVIPEITVVIDKESGDCITSEIRVSPYELAELIADRNIIRIKHGYTKFGATTQSGHEWITPALWNVFGYGAWRSLGTSTLSEEAPREQQCPHLFSDKADLINAEEWLLRLDYGAEHRSKFSSENRKRFDQVKDTLIGLLPEVEEIRIGEPIGPDRPPRLLFKTPYGEVELRQLGYGYQSLIAWVVDFAARMYETYPDSPNPLAEPAVCLVDEIDLHLHPKWQRDLMDFLSKRFPKTQFIATAHSPLIVQAAEEIGANVVVLRREGDHVVIDNDPISVKGWRVDQILSSELFDDTPLRAGDTQEWMNRRTALLKKAKLTAKEKTELQTLNAKAEELPLGRTAAEINMNDRLKNAVELLEKAAKEKK